MPQLDTPEVFVYKSELSFGNKVKRAVWDLTCALLFRPSPRIFRPWRRFLLRMFGAKLSRGANVSSTCRIWAPWNLVMDSGSSLSDGVVCYNVDKVILDEGAIVSQFAILCTSSHDITKLNVPLVTAPIHLCKRAWVGMDAFVNMGITIGEFAVVAARANVVKDVEAWNVVGGNPAKFIKQRVITG